VRRLELVESKLQDRGEDKELKAQWAWVRARWPVWREKLDALIARNLDHATYRRELAAMHEQLDALFPQPGRLLPELTLWRASERWVEEGVSFTRHAHGEPADYTQEQEQVPAQQQAEEMFQEQDSVQEPASEPPQVQAQEQVPPQAQAEPARLRVPIVLAVGSAEIPEERAAPPTGRRRSPSWASLG
jgi:hypothetical protein